MPDNVDKLFEIMQAEGAASDRDKFRKVFLTPGNKGYKIRKDIYDGLRADGIIDSPTYEDFRRKLRLGGTPTVNKYRQQMFNSVDPNKSRASELTHRAVGQAVRATNNVRKPVVAKVVNQKGKPTGEEFAITPAKTVEDLDREYAQETTKNWENELNDQMADADKDAAKISDMFKSFIGSTDEVGSVWGNMTRGGGIAGTPHSVTTNNGILENTEARQLLAAGDYNRKRRELLQLEQDSRNGAIFDNHSFFRGMYDAAKDTGFLTGGASDLINAGSLLATKQDLDNGIHTEAGDMLMQQAVKNSDAQSQYGDNQGWMYTGGVITTNMAPFMVQIGSAGFSKGMSNAIGKVVQGAASKVALGTMEKATGMAGAHIANYIGKVTGLTTKAFGKAIQYGIVGAAQANTVGLGNVANDVINRYTGQVYQDEHGNYKFGTFDSDGKLVHEGGEDFLTSLVKGEAAQTIEFATELAGGGIDAAGTVLKNFVTKGGKKIINKYNMENVSKVIDFLLNNKVSKNARYLKAGADRTLGKVELNSIVGESLEEELGIIANTVFTGDNKISDLWDEKQQSQIWGGMLLSIGLMKGIVAPFHAYNARQYYSYKHKLDKADVNLSQLLGKEKWEELRNQIDATTNDDMPEMVNKINRDVALGKNRQPVREYIQNLLIMRGYDIGNMLAAKKAVEDKGKGVSVKNMEKNQAYQQGRDAYGYDTHEIQLDQADKQKTLAQLLGITEQQLSTMSDEELDNLSGRDDNLDKAIYDYQLSTIRYQGVADNAQDQVDLAAQKAAQAVDMYTDKSRNTIRNATIKATGGLEDYGVYIINGNIATHDDGSIDVGNSDDMILFYDPTTNTVEHADATRFAELGSEENADEVRNQAVADAKENAIKEITGIIDGVVEVGTQFKAIDADGTEHTYDVLSDNGDGTAMITIDGNIPTQLVKGENVNVPVSFEELQKMKDASDQQRLQAAKAQREQMKNERAEQQMQAQTTQAENPAQENNIQSAPIEDNLDYSDIIREDGKVQMVDVSDKDGNNLFPDAKDVFYIQGNKMRTKFAYIDANGELKAQSFPTGLVKIKTRGEVSVDDYKKYRSMILSAESPAMPESSMIEDNSGTIEANRSGIEVEDNTQPLSEADADNVIAQMESSADTAPDLELTPDNWTAEFGEDGTLSTPIGDVKMGENQVAKLFEKGRSKEFGMIKPTLTDPDVIIEVPSHSADGNEERSSSYLFIKTFLGKNGEKVYYFKSVTIKKDGLEISISSHYDRAKRVKEALMKGKLLYRKNDGAQTEQNQPSASVTTSQEDAAGSSESKDTNISSNGNENNESLTFEDGTPIPVDVNGEVDLSQTDAAHAAEWYDTNLGEDADGWLDGEINKAKKVLEQAKNRKLTGTKPSELVASKKEKEAAIADAQARYDSAISIRDSLKERRIAKEENTPEGRKNLIEKARRKFSRLKSAVKDDAEAVSQLYKDVVGSLLHRLYDGTGIDVTDTIPLTAEEYVASNLGAHSLNYEGTETSKGVKQETGLSREDFAKTQLLAADGKGTTIDDLVHSLWENRPSNLESLDTQDIRNALIGVLTSGFKASEARNYIENLRIAQAENILEEQKKAADNAVFAEEQKAPAEEQTETTPESEEKTEENNSDKINDEENEQTNAPEQNKFPDKLKEGSKTIEVPDDATEENPLGLQLSEDKVPFEIEGGKSGETYNINDNEDRQRLINDNKVDDKDILDIDMPKHVHKAIKELCKKMGLKVQFLYMGARSNGWIENGTMYLALDTEKATQFVFGHEMTHAIKQKNPEAYKDLVKVAMAVTTRKKFEEDLAKVYQNYHGISGYNNVDDFVEEVVADNLGKFINDFDLAQKFSLRLNHPVLATILHAIQEIKHLLYGDFYKPVDALERIVEQAYVKTANGEVTNSETGEDVSFSLRQKPEPKKKGIGYKVFVLKDGKLYPPMVANPDGAATPVGVWLDADAAPIAGESKTGRPQVKQGGKGTQGGSGKLAYRPGWHLGVVPYAIQFNRKDAEGNKTLFPKNFVFAEVEYAADVDYQEEARQEGINPSGKYQHSLAGLKHLPTDGYYMYRTNPNPETDPWVITGAMKVNRILTRAEQAELVKIAGREPQQIQEGDIVTDDVVNSINQEIAAAPKFSLKVYHGSGADFTEFDFNHMGEGAGSQVFGWGGYVTSSKKIGKNYATLMDNDPSRAYFRIQRSNGTRFAKKYPTLESFLHGDKQIAMNDKFTEQEKIDFYNEMKKLAEPYHNLYEVDIPDDNGSNYMDWDKPLSKNQQDAIREGLEHLGVGIKTLESKGQSLERTGENVYNSTLYIGLTGTEYDLPERTKGISKFLSSVGFTGIKYKAGRNFGGAKKGDTNYIIFKPEDMKITSHTKFSLRLKSAIEETETNPSDAQKESGNYKKGHIKFGGYDYTIENPKGSTRSGKDADGKEWKVTMHDTYGYIRGKFGKDGDHLDMFINDKADLDNWNGDVFVVDQVNPDGSFDEHKVMYGYDSMDDAKKAYLANYSDGWQGLGNITGASKDEFDKWLDTSNRKLKPFADYAKVKFSLKDIKPVGVGAFGNIYNQFRGKAKAAIEFLKKLGSGEATAALHHHTIGDISLVWGDKKTGLDKILRKHPEVVDNLQSIIDSMEVVQESDNRIKLESLTHFAVVSKEYKGEPREQWLLTAYEKRESLENGKSMDTATSSLGGDTALSQSKESAAKIDNSSETAKENGEKFSLKDEKIKSVAEKFGVNEDDVAMYANAVERGSTAEAARARANIKRYLLQANEDKISSFKDIIKYTKPINEALKENFGDLDAMIEERRKQVEAQRNAMEAARKRAQEEEEKRQKHLDELSLLPTDELDKRYMDAIANNDESTAREMLDESARRNGYGDVDSDYQGQGAWAAPSNPQYESDEARRADIENSPDVNLEDIALGYNLQPDDYFDNPRAYMNNTAYGLESAHVIKNALDAIKNGEKDVKVKVYRAVPTSVKEGKLRNGDWVTPSKKYAEMHGDNRLDGKYRIIEDEVPANQLWWDGNDVNEFGFDDGKEYRYKNAKNNRKLNDLITYDNKGNVIPPSKRFNSRKSDIRFSLKEEKEKIVADAKANGTYMTAPNGEKTKLDAEQWATVRTTNFKNWFGDWENDPENASKVVDENGEPMVVWHGRSAEFNTFEKKEGVRFIMGLEDKVKAEGFFFSPDKDLAEEFASNSSRHRGGKANVVPCFLNIRRPMDLTGEDYDRIYEDVTGWEYMVGMDTQDNLWGIMDEEGMADKIKEKGYDGAIFVEEVDDSYEPTKISYCALDANQIKSAENNNGDFSSGNNDIRFSLRGSTPYDKQMEEWMEKNHLEKGAVPMEKPIMKEGENIFDYANRMVEWTRNQNLWKTAPKQTGFQDALAKWKADNGLSPDAYPPVRPHRENYSTEIGYTEDLEEYNKKKEIWKSAPKPKDFDLSVDLEDMNKQLRNIRRAVLNQKNYDQRTVKAVSDLVRKMLNIGWGDGLSRGKVGNLLSAAKNATGANDVKKYLDKAMGILAENYLNRLSTAYDNLINTRGARADQSGVIKMGSLDAKGQAFMSEYKKAINMDDSSLNNYIANIEEDSAKNEDNVEMNDYRLAGIQAAIMYKQQIGGNDADISELKRQIGELKNKKDATKEDKDLLKSLEKKLFENKFDRITMYENLLNNIQRMVKESKGRAKEFREEIAEHKNEILHRANLDLEGVDSSHHHTKTWKKKFWNNPLFRFVMSSTYTFEQFLKYFGRHHANGEGYLYNYFMSEWHDAADEQQLYNEMNRNALDEKTKELFGKKKFMKLVGIDGKGMKEMDIDIADYSNKETGKRTIHLKQGQMLYIYLVNKETDGEMKLRAMGITEEDVAVIEANLDPRVKAMGEWLQDEYLPECQRRYQATHTKYFGAPMKEVENYFPLAIDQDARNQNIDINQNYEEMSRLAGTSTGAIVTRRVNVIPLDIENADAFAVAFNHLDEMEEWSAYLPFKQDINTLLSYTHFKNQVKNVSSAAYGNGETLWKEFMQTAQIAAGTYRPKVDNYTMDGKLAALAGGIATAKISGRLWTAIKQSQSATVFLPECDFGLFVKNSVKPYGSYKWAKENLPLFRKRIEGLTIGDMRIKQFLDDVEKYHDWAKAISKFGMSANILVDSVTCAVGARSVYETELKKLTKLGYSKEKAEEKALLKASLSYNKTQQSSEGAFLSPMQVDRTYVSAALSLFKNANYAYGRGMIEACRGLAKTYDLWGGKHKITIIESMTRQIMREDGLDESIARAIARKSYYRTFRKSIGMLLNYLTLVPVSWAAYKVLPYLLTGDDDDKKQKMIEDAVLKGFSTSITDNYVIPFLSNGINAAVEFDDNGSPTLNWDKLKYQNLYINPATSDLANIYSMVANQKWYAVGNKIGMLGVQSLIGFNPETLGALYQLVSEGDFKGDNTNKEVQIAVLKAISAPEESIRELYMDELGLNNGDKDVVKKFMSKVGLDGDDINKIPLSVLEQRYAERQINRDNLLSQIFMPKEDFDGYVDKYKKSFEKKIQEKMDKMDAYDQRKFDAIFDTTTDPALKGMMEKKRAKDANAAADEQIAKEGLNQEKKGKEPSEEAYDAVKMSIDVAEDNAISTYNKVLNKRYAAMNDEYNEQTDAMKYIFMSKHPNFKAYKDLESEYTTYGKKLKELKEKLVSADGYDAKQTILKQIRAERDKFYELQSKVR